MVAGAPAAATGIQATPTDPASTAQDYEPTTPDALVAKIKEIVGDVPGLTRRACRNPEPPHRRRAGAMTVAAPSDVQPTATTRPTVVRVPVRTASAVWVLIAGVVGLAAALTLTIEKIEILINPDYVPSCSINPVLSCGSVMVDPAGVGVRLSQPADRHRRRSPSWW